MRERVRTRLEAGKRVSEIASELGDWKAIQAFYDNGHTYRETKAHFGFSSGAWGKAVETGKIVSRRNVTALETWLVEHSSVNRQHLKRRLVGAGLKDDRCEECGIAEWRGRPLAFELHHRNGVRDDNRLENLAILCPNCHSQTETFGGRNARGVMRTG